MVTRQSEDHKAHQKLIRQFVGRWRALLGVRTDDEDGPTIAKALDTFGAVALEQAIDELAAGGLSQVRRPIKFLWGWLRHAESRRKKQQTDNERAARRQQATHELLERMDRAQAEAAYPPAETFARLSALARDAGQGSERPHVDAATDGTDPTLADGWRAG